ncbi:heavy-metal-associated domain-containing protein [Streptomyces sp. NPDC051172]|uniref:heavy-metal-associated domain-containing protein n=1 Tax=Streptomyces sp. NPDC051172 TaxID=3155796 RepID=UPI00344527BC
MAQKHYSVTGMTCEHCAASIREEVSVLPLTAAARHQQAAEHDGRRSAPHTRTRRESPGSTGTRGSFAGRSSSRGEHALVPRQLEIGVPEGVGAVGRPDTPV